MKKLFIVSVDFYGNVGINTDAERIDDDKINIIVKQKGDIYKYRHLIEKQKSHYYTIWNGLFSNGMYCGFYAVYAENDLEAYNIVKTHPFKGDPEHFLFWYNGKEKYGI